VLILDDDTIIHGVIKVQDRTQLEIFIMADRLIGLGMAGMSNLCAA